MRNSSLNVVTLIFFSVVLKGTHFMKDKRETPFYQMRKSCLYASFTAGAAFKVWINFISELPPPLSPPEYFSHLI